MINTFENFNLKNIINVLNPGCVTVLAGAPGSGKTLLALNIAAQYGILEGKNVVIFSLEMLQRQLIFNMGCLLSKVYKSRARSGNLTAEEWEKIGRTSVELLTQLNINIDETSIITPQYIEKQIQSFFVIGRGADIAIVDYLQLLSATKECPSRQEEIKAIINELDSIAKKFNISVLVPCQLARADFKYNSNINEVKADHTIAKFSSSNEQWLLLKTDDIAEQFDVCIVKGENTGKVIPVTFERQTGRFTEKE